MSCFILINMISLNDPLTFTAKAKDQSHETYSLHRPARKKFPTRTTRAKRVDQFWQADLNELFPFEKENNGNKYILTVIDVFSRYAYARGLKNKTATSVINAFKSIFKENNGKQPKYLHTDQGKEFENKYFHEFLGKKTKQFSVKSSVKASIVERFNRTLKERMFRYFTYSKTNQWINVLQKFVDGYNNTQHRTLKMTPNEAKLPKNRLKVFKLQEKRVVNKKVVKSKFKVGDYVRLSKKKGIFEKGFTANWTKEIFVIHKINTKYPPVMYIVKDLQDNVLEGKFYQKELQKFDMFVIEKVIKATATKSLVKYKNFKKPEWIANKDIKWLSS